MGRSGRRRRRRSAEVQGDMLDDAQSPGEGDAQVADQESSASEDRGTWDPASADEATPDDAAEPRVTIPVSTVSRRVAELERRSDFAEALALVRDALTDRAADPELLLLEIHLLGLMGRFVEAEESLRTLRLAEGERMEVRRSAGILAFRRRKHDDAEAELRAALEAGDDSGETHYYLGETLNRENRVEEALEILRVGVELNPRDPRIYKTMGRLMDRKGEMAEAAVMYRRARELEG